MYVLAHIYNIILQYVQCAVQIKHVYQHFVTPNAPDVPASGLVVTGCGNIDKIEGVLCNGESIG